MVTYRRENLVQSKTAVTGNPKQGAESQGVL